MSFLGIEGCHAFVTGARGGIGEAIVQELLGIFSLFLQGRWDVHVEFNS
jgi:NAD(P)-dependent dehydrogenase (short-subunit alcohol dehydrogenase family)